MTKQKAESESPTPRIKKAGDKSTKVIFLVMALSGLSTLHLFVASKNFRPYSIKPLAHIRSTDLIKNNFYFYNTK